MLDFEIPQNFTLIPNSSTPPQMQFFLNIITVVNLFFKEG